MNNIKEKHDSLTDRVAKRYSKDGYNVLIEPKLSDLPFDLGSYRPDILAVKSENEGLIIQIKSNAAHLSVDKFRDIAETIAQHRGWRFLLITGDDVSANQPVEKFDGHLPDWTQIQTKIKSAQKLFHQQEYEGAFLKLWSAFEALMRKKAETASIPIERFPASSLINHLYSQGELSIEQFDKILELLAVRNQLIHGFEFISLKEKVLELQKLASELLALWHPKENLTRKIEPC